MGLTSPPHLNDVKKTALLAEDGIPKEEKEEMNSVDSPIHDDWEIVKCHLLLLLVRPHRQLHDHHCLEIDVDDEDDDVGHRDDNIGWDGNVGRKDEVPQCYEYLKHYNQHQLELMLSFPNFAFKQMFLNFPASSFQTLMKKN